MRKIGVPIIVIVASVVLAGCGGSSSSSNSSGSGGSSAPVTLTLWHNYGTEANAVATKNLVTAYEAQHPNVTIKVVSQPADNYFALLKAAAISHTGPDIAVQWTGLFTLQDTSFLLNTGGGVKISLVGPLRLRVDYRVFKLGSDALYSPAHRIYLGVNLKF